MDINSFAPCGLICGLCKETHEGCKGCRFGGGDQNCYQLNCCKEKGIAGCWECESFPCDKGYFVDEKWKGVITGFARCVREDGAEKLYEFIKSRFGNSINYHDLTSISEEKILKMLRCKKT
jgi:hypothetical protein